MTLLREAIGDSLRRARLAQSRTLREVSTSARVSLGYLSEVERGRKEASSELLAAICEALDVPLSRVLWDVSTIIADSDMNAVGAEQAASAGDTATVEPETVSVPAAEPATVVDADRPAPAEVETASVGTDTAVARPQIDEDTRIVIPAPKNETLVLVKVA
ncbi:helix-turn-helix domain-containing protein [Nocardia paucivorans]|uniref:helix-turn-helix domain-containing protein n=1 Tax=Nocardia paucivorans TaxID=114259 RepID=UPI00059383DC|nr:helix-turn-helix transcriptional regulator [Nocardia paucivorans]